MQTHEAKRVAITIEAMMQRRLTCALREAGVTGYAIPPVLGGSGRSGDLARAGQVGRAEGMVQELTQEAELERVYLGKVKRITDFGAFVEIFPGTDGLIHISHLAEGRVDKVTDIVSEGDEVMAKCIDIDPAGRIRLSRKEALAEAASEGE